LTGRTTRRGLKSLLLLEDGTLIEGWGFGKPGVRVGEIVFTTGMVGYTESLTDPSYEGQILIITHPLVGNYGVARKHICENGLPLHFESDRIHVEALVVAYETDPSHWASGMSLHEWLESEGVPGISHVDTRFLVKKIREKGVMMAALAVYPEDEDFDAEKLVKLLESSTRYDEINFVKRVSPKKPLIHKPRNKLKGTIVLVDCGVKYGIVRELLRRGFQVVRIPYNENPMKYVYEYKASGVLFSNGPGNPERLVETVKNAKEVLEYGIPALGICLGHQILAIADGATTYKLRYGHRGHNKPCLDVLKGKCFVTSQNHGYTVDVKSLENTGFKLWMINIDDKSVEGLLHTRNPVITTQFHPEASPGPLDSEWIFDLFEKMVVKHGNTI